MSDHPRGRIAGWILLALAGLAVAVALSVTASNLSTQPIGLAGEPLRAGDKLAPASVNANGSEAPVTKTTTTTTTTTNTTTQPAPTGTTDTDHDRGHELGPDSDDD